MDPTLNPITRRPGPGRGRPKKQLLAEAAAAGVQDSTHDSGPDQQQPVTQAMDMSLRLSGPPSETEALAVDPSLEDADEQMIKRPRLDDPQDPSLDEEAVLSALSAHGNPEVVDQYSQE
jgi:hypothetical protein